jgi:sensor histidine kinase regulating citrate/malate metabolism
MMEKDDMEVFMLKQRLENVENSVAMLRSQHINDLLNVLAMLEDGEYNEAEEYLRESTS